MILVDLNGVAIAGIMAQINSFGGLDEALVRHFILNSLRSYRSRFHRHYDEMVLCCDGSRSWRKDYYPYYKAKRKAARDKSAVDWKALFSAMDTVRAELAAIFPYPILQVEGAEADDIIAILSRQLTGPHMVISNDRDLAQLQLENVDIFSPLKNSKVGRIANMREHLTLHILKGDSTDGIPNVLSDDDAFVNPDKRQRPLRKTKISELMNSKMDEDVLRNYKRNETLIDLTCIPEEIESKIIVGFEEAEEKVRGRSRSALQPYFIQKKLRNLYDSINDF